MEAPRARAVAESGITCDVPIATATATIASFRLPILTFLDTSTTLGGAGVAPVTVPGLWWAQTETIYPADIFRLLTHPKWVVLRAASTLSR